VHIPTLNAMLNLLSLLFVIAGIISIKNKRVDLHRLCMAGALVFSVIFLTFYLYYHYNSHLVTTFVGPTALKILYYIILFSHIPLAAVIAPAVVIVAVAALRQKFSFHTRWARRVVPVWIYVSITGVLIWLFLYPLGYGVTKPM